MRRNWRALIISAAALLVGITLGSARHELPTFNDAVLAVSEIGFAPVAFFIVTIGLGGIIIWAVGYFISKLDSMSDRISDGQDRIVDALRDQTRAQAVVAEDLRLLIMQATHTQESVNVATTEIVAHRESVEPAITAAPGILKEIRKDTP